MLRVILLLVAMNLAGCVQESPTGSFDLDSHAPGKVIEQAGTWLAQSTVKDIGFAANITIRDETNCAFLAGARGIQRDQNVHGWLSMVTNSGGSTASVGSGSSSYNLAEVGLASVGDPWSTEARVEGTFAAGDWIEIVLVGFEIRHDEGPGAFVSIECEEPVFAEVGVANATLFAFALGDRSGSPGLSTPVASLGHDSTLDFHANESKVIIRAASQPATAMLVGSRLQVDGPCGAKATALGDSPTWFTYDGCAGNHTLEASGEHIGAGAVRGVALGLDAGIVGDRMDFIPRGVGGEAASQ